MSVRRKQTENFDSFFEIKYVILRFGNYGSLATAVPQFNWEYRDNGTVKATPTIGFREANELYYDGAEGTVLRIFFKLEIYQEFLIL